MALRASTPSAEARATLKSVMNDHAFPFRAARRTRSPLSHPARPPRPETGPDRAASGAFDRRPCRPAAAGARPRSRHPQAALRRSAAADDARSRRRRDLRRPDGRQRSRGFRQGRDRLDRHLPEGGCSRSSASAWARRCWRSIWAARVYTHGEGRAEVGYYRSPSPRPAPPMPAMAGFAWPGTVYQWHRDGFDCPVAPNASPRAGTSRCRPFARDRRPTASSSIPR